MSQHNAVLRKITIWLLCVTVSNTRSPTHCILSRHMMKIFKSTTKEVHNLILHYRDDYSNNPRPPRIMRQVKGRPGWIYFIAGCNRSG